MARTAREDVSSVGTEAMSVMDCCAAAITGIWDQFDISVMDWLEEMLNERYPISIDASGIVDSKAEERAKVMRAKALVREACLLCQQVLEAI